MCGFTNVKNWLKGQVPLSIFISLCISIVFVPELSEATLSISAPVSISHISNNCALLPIPFTVGDNLCRAKLNRSETYGKRVSAQDELARFGTYDYFIPSPHSISDCISRFDTTFKRAFQQACQLLDIPPPSSTIS